MCVPSLAVETFGRDLFVLCGHFGVEMLWQPCYFLAVSMTVKCYWFISRSVLALVFVWACACVVRGPVLAVSPSSPSAGPLSDILNDPLTSVLIKKPN